MCSLDIGLMKWKSIMEKGGGNKKISVLYWLLRRISFPLSSSTSFRTQSYWSFITGQCLDSGFSSSAFNMLDVQSMYIPSSIQDWYLEAKFWAEDRQYSLCMWLYGSRTKILRRSTWKHRVLHGKCIHRERNIKTRSTGSIHNLLKRND